MAKQPQSHTAPEVDVIIPVYRGAAETRRCIEGALKSRNKTPHRIVVIDDATPEPAIARYLDGLAAAGRIRLLRHAENLGYTRTINEGLRLHPECDAVLLNSDTLVSNDWLDRLRRCAYAEADIGTVNPFSNNATICSYPLFCENNGLVPQYTAEGLDRLFRGVNAGRWGEVPTTVGFCMYIKSACLAQVGPFDEERFPRGYGEENDFCMRARRLGWRHALCGDTFVFHAGSVSFGAAKEALLEQSRAVLAELHPDYESLVREHVMADPNRNLRTAVDAARRGRKSPRASSHPPTAALDPAARQTVSYKVVLVARNEPVDALLATLEAVVSGSVDHAPILVVDTTGSGAAYEAVSALYQAHPGLPLERVAVQQPPVQEAAGWAAAFGHVLGDGGEDDFLFIQAGVAPPYAWDARLRRAAKAEPGIGSASPMSEHAALFSFRATFEDAPDAPETEVQPDSLDCLAYVLSDRRYYEVPLFSPPCVYLNREALATLPGNRDLHANDTEFPLALARSLRRRGFQHLLCDHLVVDVPVEARNPALDASLSTDEREMLDRHPLGKLRHALADAVAQGFEVTHLPGLEAKTVQLHVMHSWGGGLARWVSDYAGADSDRINLVLKSVGNGDAYGARLALYLDAADTRPIRSWDLALPIKSISAGHVEYRRILRRIVEEFCVDKVLISSLIGHSLDTLKSGRQTLLLAHDYLPYCPAIHIYFDGICRECGVDRLTDCFAHNEMNTLVGDYTGDEWQALRDGFFAAAKSAHVSMVAPSRSVKRHLCALDARFGEITFRTIPHGAAFHAEPLPEPEPPAGRLRIVVLGRLTPEKGLALFAEIHPALGEIADIHLLGCGDSGLEFADEPHITVTPAYQLEELPRLLEENAPHIGLLLSIWPETFSYTLSELMAYGIPPVATDTGSFADRIKEGTNGFLVPADDPEALVARLRELAAKPRLLHHVRQRLAKSSHKSLVAMVDDYHRELPAEHPPVARYPLQVGRHTGLTEPYRHLTEAYNRLSRAFTATQGAMNQTRAAYDKRTQQVEKLTATVTELESDISAKIKALEQMSQLVDELSSRMPQDAILNRSEIAQRMFNQDDHVFARTRPEVLKSPWWIGHIPFAFELIKRLKPRSIVELGTYSGSSFFAFCQAVETLDLPAKCYGIDLWEGDIHMGQFQETLFEEISGYVSSRHADTGILVRKLFDDAAHDFEDGSVDLLHIDGTHTLEAVSNDFRTWLPKLSERGVVIFHDTNVTREMVGKAADDFGVREFFDSVKSDYPHLEFSHCYGLGVLMVGKAVPEAVLSLVGQSQDPAFYAYYEELGNAVSRRFQEEEAARQATADSQPARPSILSRLRNRLRRRTHRSRRTGSVGT